MENRVKIGDVIERIGPTYTDFITNKIIIEGKYYVVTYVSKSRSGSRDYIDFIDLETNEEFKGYTMESFRIVGVSINQKIKEELGL